MNKGYPQQASQSEGRGFFTAPGRTVSNNLVRELSSTFDDHWTQPRLFYNSLTKVEQQFVINAIRFETSQLKSETVKKNVLAQLNRVSHDVAVRVASAIGMEAPAADDTYYHNNVTAGLSIISDKLASIATLKVTILSSIAGDSGAMAQAAQLKERFTADGLVVSVVAEKLAEGVDKVYAAADATDGDALIVVSGAGQAGLFDITTKSTLYPAQRPLQIAAQSYLYGKPVAYFGPEKPGAQLAASGFDAQLEGVYVQSSLDEVVKSVEEGLKTFKFTSRFAMDEE